MEMVDAFAETALTAKAKRNATLKHRTTLIFIEIVLTFRAVSLNHYWPAPPAQSLCSFEHRFYVHADCHSPTVRNCRILLGIQHCSRLGICKVSRQFCRRFACLLRK
jgi:hypothetical protein